MTHVCASRCGPGPAEAAGGGAARARALAALLLPVLGLLLPAAPLRIAAAQDVAVASVADSPTAQQLLRQVEDLAASNPEEAARILQAVLEQHPQKLVPIDAAGDRFITARERALAILRASPGLLERWQRTAEPDARRLLQEGQLELAVASRPGTPSAMEAALRLAQADLEAGRFAAVAAGLAEIRPEDLKEPRARTFAIFMRGMALARLGDAVAATTAAAELESMDANADGDAAAHARTLAAAVRAALPVAASPAPDRPPDAQPWHRIWRLPIAGSAYSRRYLDPEGPLVTLPTPEAAAEEGSLLTVLPLVSGETLFVADGPTVSAVDRLSHRVRWTQSFAPPMGDRDTAAIGDLTQVVAAADSLLCITGHATSGKRSGAGRLICLDAATGALRWERRLEGLGGDDTEGLFPHGTPVVVDDTVVMMARKVNSRLESVGFVVGVDLHTGGIRWITHLAGCGGVHLGGIRPFGSPLAAAGGIFVSSSLGAVARLDPGTGAIRWLTRFPVPIRDARYPCMPWELAEPVLLPQGLLAIAPDQTRVVLLDPETGEERRSFPIGSGEAWGIPRYLVADRERSLLLAVGEDVVAFSPSDLERPRWTLTGVLPAPLRGQSNRSGIRGRVQILESAAEGPAVVVAGLDEVLVLSAKDGTPLRRIETAQPGNPLLVDDQLFLAGNERLESFMPLGRAEASIRGWLEKDPADPERAMALLDLGVQSRNPALVLEGAERALAALESGAPRVELRGELLSRLLAAQASPLGAADAAGESLLALASRTASTAPQQVAARLALGDWMERHGRAIQAVQAWQSILSDPSLRTASVASRDDEALASALALARMAALARAAGPTSLDAREQDAAQALQQVKADSASDLADFAAAWVGTAAGARAAIRVADTLVAAQRRVAAFALLASTISTTSRLRGTAGEVAPLLQRMVELADTPALRGAAGVEVAALLARSGDASLPPALHGSVSRLLASIAPGDGAVRKFPAVGTQPSQPVRVDGRLATLSAEAADERPDDRALLVERTSKGRRVTMRRTPDLGQVWEHAVDVDDPVVAAWGERIVLWQRNPGDDPSLLALAAGDGSVAWKVPSVASLFTADRLLESGPGLTVSPRDGRLTQASDVVAVRAGETLILVRRNGDLVGVNLGDGSTPWRREHVFDVVDANVDGRVSPMAGSSHAAAITGRVRQPDGTLRTVVALIDPSSGDLLGKLELDGGRDVAWTAFAPGPSLVVGTDMGLECVSIPSGVRLWSREDRRLRGATPWTVVGDHLLLGVQRIGGMLREEPVAIDLTDGQPEGTRFALPSRHGWVGSTIRQLTRAGSGVLLAFEDRIVLFDSAGAIQGSDAVAADRSYTGVFPARDTIVAIDGAGLRPNLANPERFGGVEGGGVLYQFSRVDGGRLITDGLEIRSGEQSPDRWLLVEGGVIGSTQGWTVSLPLLPETGR